MSSDQVLHLLISGELAVDRVAEAAFQRSPGLRRGLRLCQFALVELASWSLGADLADRDQVQRPIQLTVPGAAGAYRRAALDAVGGFDGATVAEDTDLTLAIVDAGWRVGFAPEAIADTAAPATVESLWRQRSRLWLSSRTCGRLRARS